MKSVRFANSTGTMECGLPSVWFTLQSWHPKFSSVAVTLTINHCLMAVFLRFFVLTEVLEVFMGSFFFFFFFFFSFYSVKPVEIHREDKVSLEVAVVYWAICALLKKHNLYLTKA